jgi:radical SAM protein with 4Fe4S-binding SPASM domain
MREILASHGVTAWQLQFGNPTGNMADHRELVIPPQDLLTIIPRIAALRRAGGMPRIHPSDNVGYYGEFERDLRDDGGPIPYWIGCRAGLTVLGIESNGNIKGCLSLPSAMNQEDRFVEGNVRQRSLREIWEDPNGFSYNRQFEVEHLRGFCRTCDYAEICRGGCSWTSFAHTGECGGNPYCYHRQFTEQAARAAT